MRAIRLSFLHMLKLIRHDMMLFAAGLAPLLAGVAIRFGVPFLEKLLVSYTGAETALTPYYGLFDIFFASIAPAMFGFIAAMVMLEEHDDPGGCRALFCSETYLLLLIHFAVFLDRESNPGKCADLYDDVCPGCGYLDFGAALFDGFHQMTHFFPGGGIACLTDDLLLLIFGHAGKTDQGIGVLCELHGESDRKFFIVDHILSP